ncbi:hypothetical protein CSQ92_01715 [Janthinobacterium sp. BJB446]|uniref:KAP family P-loop NTPase fold protein n=1 Tax=Janthinobacterium sp. BJB446 TaxID=2048009 RepID=UPI000C0D1C9A|nr:P-loop NTPase fold protein [Janthinobacterium sp. BJB446]PHV21849.1 hypothetical protein CSQ92_01715 [Janthinobacterium sp. BJB446]
MSFRISEIDIPLSEPFKNDALDRDVMVEFMANVIEKASGKPLVIAVDAPYGSGKSTFIGMLNAVLINKNYQTVNFNAWKADHVSDPLVAMVAALDEALPKAEDKTGKLKAGLAKVRNITGKVARRVLVAGVKVGTAGVLDIEDGLDEIIRDAAGDAVSDIVEIFQNETKLNISFRSELEHAVSQLELAQKNSTLVFFIDELDRCRPDFAISLLERVKHMFDVPNIAFILSVDKRQLEAATAAVYGERINAAEYLRKFIDLEFGLPLPHNKKFVEMAVARSGLSALFSLHSQDGGAYQCGQFTRFLTLLSRILRLTLRTQERCITRMKLVLDQTPMGHSSNPIHVALLVVLRAVDQEFFYQTVKGILSPDEVLNFFRAKPEGENALNSTEGRILHALLVTEDRNDERKKEFKKKLIDIMNENSSTRDDASKASEMLNLLDSFGMDGEIFPIIARKIDIAAQIRD